MAGALLLAGVTATGAAAQSTSVTGTATLTVTETLHIEVDGLVGLTFTFDAAQWAAASPYYVLGSQASTVRHKGNVTHSVNLRADAATFTGTGGARLTKPVSDMEARLEPNGGSFGAWTALSDASDFGVVASAAAGDYMTTPGTVEYRINVDGADTPGTYELDFTYTILAG
jgi:hypothetical protein